ncbi:MAG TPA: type II CAAX endopeptidase family protein [Candidatus Nitrosocosmicus sp.]|nr:type II CAAX endopeptidase family protein [Candidatus Nitrosocosmicus sp.]
MMILFYLLPLLVIGWTVWGIFAYKELKTALKKGEREALLREYKITILGEIIGGLIAFGAIGHEVFKPSDTFGIRFGEMGNGVIAAAAIALLLSLIIVPLLAKLGKNVIVGDIEVLLPRTKNEKLWFILVALSAGVCEELIFRGYALRLFESIGFSGLPLLIVTAVVFGLVHIYQGFLGAIMTAVMGVLFTLIYIQTGSLWWAIAAHIFIDLRVLLIVAFAKKH